MLQQFRRRRPPHRIPLEAPFQKVDAAVAQLVARRQLRLVALRNVVHDGPLVVQGRPRSAACRHLKDHAAERPDVDDAGAAGACVAADDFGRHVHGRSLHGFFLAACDGGVGDHGFALARDYFGRAEVDVFDHAVLI